MLDSPSKDGVSLCCIDCKEYKDTSEFAKDRSTRTGLRGYCRACDVIRQRRYANRKRQDDPVGFDRKRRDSQYRRRYGITIDQYDFLFDFQNGVCALCSCRYPEGQPLCVDHIDCDDGAPFVRGLLCHPCNTLLGKLRECPEYCRHVLRYLEDGYLLSRGMAT